MNIQEFEDRWKQELQHSGDEKGYSDAILRQMLNIKITEEIAAQRAYIKKTIKIAAIMTLLYGLFFFFFYQLLAATFISLAILAILFRVYIFWHKTKLQIPFSKPVAEMLSQTLKRVEVFDRWFTIATCLIAPVLLIAIAVINHFTAKETINYGLVIIITLVIILILILFRHKISSLLLSNPRITRLKEIKSQLIDPV